MFSNELRERLRRGKYSDWAVNLTEDQIEAIIWLIGEYGQRAEYILPLLTPLWEKEGSGRAALALEDLFRVYMGDRPNLAASSSRVNAFLYEVRGLAKDKGFPPAHNWPVKWQEQIVGCIAYPVLGIGGCSCSGVWWPAGKDATEFLAAVGQPSSRVGVVVGGISGWVMSPPNESGRIEFGLSQAT